MTNINPHGEDNNQLRKHVGKIAILLAPATQAAALVPIRVHEKHGLSFDLHAYVDAVDLPMAAGSAARITGVHGGNCLTISNLEIS